MTAEYWKAWAEGLNIYYRNPPSGTILSNHIFVISDSASPTIHKRQEYRDAEAVEFDLHPTSKSRKDSVGVTAEERTEDLPNLPSNLTPLKAPGLSAEKAYRC